MRFLKVFVVGAVVIVLSVAYFIYMQNNQNKNKTMPSENIQITKEQAIQIATEDNGGFLGTWVEATLENGNWQISARSKSDTPPVLYVIDAKSGKIVYKNLNTDETPVPKQF